MLHNKRFFYIVLCWKRLERGHFEWSCLKQSTLCQLFGRKEDLPLGCWWSIYWCHLSIVGCWHGWILLSLLGSSIVLSIFEKWMLNSPTMNMSWPVVCFSSVSFTSDIWHLCDSGYAHWGLQYLLAELVHWSLHNNVSFYIIIFFFFPEVCHTSIDTATFVFFSITLALWYHIIIFRWYVSACLIWVSVMFSCVMSNVSKL